MDNNFFKLAGDLGGSMGDNPLRPAGDLGVSSNNSFKFEEKKERLNTPKEIREWLKTLVSGRKMSGEGCPAFGGGKMMVTLDELKRMVDNGDNIISAEYIEGINCVNVEFESFSIPSRSR